MTDPFHGRISLPKRLAPQAACFKKHIHTGDLPFPRPTCSMKNLSATSVLLHEEISGRASCFTRSYSYKCPAPRATFALIDSLYGPPVPRIFALRAACSARFSLPRLSSHLITWSMTDWLQKQWSPRVLLPTNNFQQVQLALQDTSIQATRHAIDWLHEYYLSIH